jgi:hypothetical protein
MRHLIFAEPRNAQEELQLEETLGRIERQDLAINAAGVVLLIVGALCFFRAVQLLARGMRQRSCVFGFVAFVLMCAGVVLASVWTAI